MLARTSTLVGTDTLDMIEGMPMMYTWNGSVVKGLSRVLEARIDSLFLHGWAEFSFEYAGIIGKKGICAFDDSRTIVVFFRTLNDREKLELAKQLLGE
jgi:hypothetical protein